MGRKKRSVYTLLVLYFAISFIQNESMAVLSRAEPTCKSLFLQSTTSLSDQRANQLLMLPLPRQSPDLVSCLALALGPGDTVNLLTVFSFNMTCKCKQPLLLFFRILNFCYFPTSSCVTQRIFFCFPSSLRFLSPSLFSKLWLWSR